MKKSIIIGLTGQTGSGKSTVCSFALSKGAAVINADSVAREVVQKGSRCLAQLAEAFGGDIIKSSGELDRKLLAKRAFSDKEKTGLLNSITHPFIIKSTAEKAEELRNQGYQIIVFDAPQLFESGADKICDVIVTVTAPEEIRLERIIRRDGLAPEEARLRMNAQLDEEYFRENSDYLIDGSKSIDEVKQEIGIVLEKIMSEKMRHNEKEAPDE